MPKLCVIAGLVGLMRRYVGISGTAGACKIANSTALLLFQDCFTLSPLPLSCTQNRFEGSGRACQMMIAIARQDKESLLITRPRDTSGCNFSLLTPVLRAGLYFGEEATVRCLETGNGSPSFSPLRRLRKIVISSRISRDFEGG